MKRIVGLALAFAAGAALSPVLDAGADASGTSPFANLSIFARAIAHIEAAYVDPVDQDKLIHGAIRGMASSLDPHTVYLDPDEYRLLTSDTQGQFAGVGVEISVRDGWLTILATFEGGPAARAGLQPGDRFVHLAGRPARDMRIADAVRIMRGPPGSTVQVGIRRQGEEETLQVELTREIIEVNPVSARLFPGGILYVELRAFQANTTDELRRAIDRGIQEAGGELSGLLLDLRNNPGGLLRESVAVADEFLSSGTIVSTRGRGGSVLAESTAHRRGTRPDWPLVVLVNGYSASAAEILAGALHDHQRATLVGTTTWGKGSVQNVVELPDGGALKMTIARYYTPSGRSIQAAGIEPDVLVEQLAPAALRAARVETDDQPRESSLAGHLDQNEPGETEEGAARDQLRTEGDDEESAPFATDHQARMALQTLRAIITDRANR